MDKARKGGWWTLLLIAALTLAADQATKYLVVTNLNLYETWSPIPALAGWLDIHYVTNTGAAFGLFQNVGGILALPAVLVSLVILFYYRHIADESWPIRLSLGLVLGGALGNLIDRVRLGHVIDFIDPHIWPVFNLADSAVVCGVAILAFVLLQQEREERRRPHQVAEQTELPKSER